MMRAGYASQESELGMKKFKRLITDEEGFATAMAIGYGLIDLGMILFGNVCGQSMKTLSLVYRWCWGGIC